MNKIIKWLGNILNSEMSSKSKNVTNVKPDNRCICEMNRDGEMISGLCTKHNTTWV